VEGTFIELLARSLNTRITVIKQKSSISISFLSQYYRNFDQVIRFFVFGRLRTLLDKVRFSNNSNYQLLTQSLQGHWLKTKRFSGVLSCTVFDLHNFMRWKELAESKSNITWSISFIMFLLT